MKKHMIHNEILANKEGSKNEKIEELNELFMSFDIYLRKHFLQYIHNTHGEAIKTISELIFNIKTGIERDANFKTTQEKLLKANQEEIQKCKDSPLYFYNNYVRKDWELKLTEDEYNKWVEEIMIGRNAQIKIIYPYNMYPISYDECFNYLL